MPDRQGIDTVVSSSVTRPRRMIDVIRVGNRTVSTEAALAYARRYLQTPDENWSYPGYDAYLRDTASVPLTEADLLAPILLNVQHMKLRTYYCLLRELPRLQDLLEQLKPELTLEQASERDLEVLGQLFSGIDDGRLHGTSGTTMAKILHRKRPALIPLYDQQVGSCYQHGVEAPVPVVRGRRWDVFMPLFAQAVRADLVQHMSLWTEVCALATEPPITQLRALDIVAWHLGGGVPVEHPDD